MNLVIFNRGLYRARSRCVAALKPHNQEKIGEKKQATDHLLPILFCYIAYIQYFSCIPTNCTGTI